MKFDLKSFIVGLVLGGVLMFAFGYDGITTSAVRWGLIVPAQNKVLVRGRGGEAFVVDVDKNRAEPVEYDPTKRPATLAQLNISATN